MSTNSEKKNNRWGNNKDGWKVKQYDQIWKAMQKILDTETIETMNSDAQLTEKIRGMGVYTTDTITRTVRCQHEVGSVECRVSEVFARNFKKTKGN